MENSYALQHVLERYNVMDIQLAYRFEEMKGLNLRGDFIFVLLKMFEEEGSFPVVQVFRIRVTFNLAQEGCDDLADFLLSGDSNFIESSKSRCSKTLNNRDCDRLIF